MNKKLMLMVVVMISALTFTSYIDKPEDIDRAYVQAASTQYIKSEPEEATIQNLAAANLTSSEVLTPRYGFTEDDVYLMAQLLSGDKKVDGDGEYDIDFRVMDEKAYFEVNKVFSVVMNRVRDKRFANTVHEIILQKKQFDVMPRNTKAIPSDITLKVTRQWCSDYDAYLTNVSTIPDDHIYFYGNGKTNRTYSNWN